MNPNTNQKRSRGYKCEENLLVNKFETPIYFGNKNKNHFGRNQVKIIRFLVLLAIISISPSFADAFPGSVGIFEEERTNNLSGLLDQVLKLLNLSYFYFKIIFRIIS